MNNTNTVFTPTLFFHHFASNTNRRFGLVLAEVNPQTKEYRLSWSFCSGKHGDTFNSSKAMDIAKVRMEGIPFSHSPVAPQNFGEVEWKNANGIFPKNLPHSLRSTYAQVLARVYRVCNPRPKTGDLAENAGSLVGRFMGKVTTAIMG